MQHVVNKTRAALCFYWDKSIISFWVTFPLFHFRFRHRMLHHGRVFSIKLSEASTFSLIRPLSPSVATQNTRKERKRDVDMELNKSSCWERLPVSYWEFFIHHPSSPWESEQQWTCAYFSTTFVSSTRYLHTLFSSTLRCCSLQNSCEQSVSGVLDGDDWTRNDSHPVTRCKWLCIDEIGVTAVTSCLVVFRLNCASIVIEPDSLT